MPFSERGGITSDQWTFISEQIFLRGVESSETLDSYQCNRIALDRGDIIRGIVNSLGESHVVFADLTTSNANVFYELGVRHVLARGTFLFAQSIRDIPFDLRPYSCHEYGFGTERELQRARKLVERCLNDFEANPDAPDSPVADFAPERFSSATHYRSQSAMPEEPWNRSPVPKVLFEDLFSDNSDHGFRYESILATSTGQRLVPNEAHRVEDHQLKLELTTGYAVCTTPGIYARDIAIEAEVNLRNHGSDITSWAGIQLRSFNNLSELRPDTSGYLLYLRGTAQVELQTPEAHPRVVFDIPYQAGEWVTLRMMLSGNSARIEIPGKKKKRTLTDLNYLGPGGVALLTFLSEASFRNIGIWALEQPGDWL